MIWLEKLQLKVCQTFCTLPCLQTNGVQSNELKLRNISESFVLKNRMKTFLQQKQRGTNEKKAFTTQPIQPHFFPI